MQQNEYFIYTDYTGNSSTNFCEGEGGEGCMGAQELQGGAGKPAALSVSAAMGLAKGALESVTVKILGEVSELSNKAGYKAVYFTVKDDRASLPCMMWNNRYASCGVDLQIGSLVELTGRFTLYAAKGRMNFDVFSIALAGEGNLRLQVANLAKKLQAEGLMDASRKRPLPYIPQKVGLVTSPRGAAVYDVLRTLRRRNPMLQVLVAGVPVEGAVAPPALADGLAACANAGADVILLVRGGGSFEDLMPFNDEGLARAVAACPVPVVTGIGHEPDTSIADMVSDFRASTPTAAAEAVAVSMQELQSVLDGMGAAAVAATRRGLDAQKTKLDMIAATGLFKNPLAVLAQPARALDYYKARLQAGMSRLCASPSQKIVSCRSRFAGAGSKILPQKRADAALKNRALAAAQKTSIAKFKNACGMYAARLDDLSPLKTLGRGYSIVKAKDGAIVSSIDKLALGQDVSCVFGDGQALFTVKDKKKEVISIEVLEG